MKILVIDRDPLTCQLISSKLVATGHEVVVEQNKNAAIELIGKYNFDCIMLDPAPLREAQPIINGIWKVLPNDKMKPYIFLLSKTAEPETAIISGCNDVLNKPINTDELHEKVDSTERFIEICNHLEKEDKDIASIRMINKSAFNQLFLSATDRAFRYGERSLIVFINIGNYEEIKKQIGEKEREEIMGNISDKMAFMRRQSDVIGHIGNGNFAILLQRPQYEEEPFDAINRFAETLDGFRRQFAGKKIAPEFELDLVEIPQGTLHENRLIPEEIYNSEEGGQKEPQATGSVESMNALKAMEALKALKS